MSKYTFPKPEGGLTDLSGAMFGAVSRKLLKTPKLEIYEDHKGEWRWKISMSSDEVAASTEGYSSKQVCIDNLKKLPSYIATLEKQGLLK